MAPMIKELPCTFGGEANECVRTFLAKVDNACGSAGIQGDRKLNLTKLALKGKAALWATQLEEDQTHDDDAAAILANYDSFKTEMLRKYGPARTMDQIAALMATLIMKRGETAEEFWDRCLQALAKKNFRRTNDDKRSDVYKRMHCEDMQCAVLRGVLPEIKKELPAFDTVTLAEFKKLFLTTYDKMLRDGTIRPSGPVAASLEVAAVSTSTDVANLVKKFSTWATNLEAKGKLSAGVFDNAKALGVKKPEPAQPQPAVAAVAAGRGAGRGRGRQPANNPGPKNFACDFCSEWGHGWRECPKRPQRGRGQSQAPKEAVQQPKPMVNAVSYASAVATRPPPQQPQQQQAPAPYYYEPQQQQPDGAGALFPGQWGFQ
jgi:hypothetical protein